jgi:antiviral defense system Shedu protein SduA
MARDYEMDSTSRQSARLFDVILRETSGTRLIVRPEIVDNQKLPEAGVKVTLIHQRRSSAGKWQDVPAEPLSKLKTGEGVCLHLDSATTLQLKICLTDLYAISSSGGVRSGHTKLTVTEADKLIRLDHDRAQIIKLLLSQQRGSEIWKALESDQPDLATTLSYGRVAAERARTSAEFRDRLKRGGFSLSRTGRGSLKKTNGYSDTA